MEEKQQQEHRAGQMFDVNNLWCVPCSCGENFSAPSPTGATAKHNKHVGSVSKAERQTTNTTPARAKNCGCGCGEPLAARANGLFRSGHDARFKSILTEAYAKGLKVRHPLTGEDTDAMEVAAWLDERRGTGSFWRDKVAAGHKEKPARIPRQATAPATEEDRVARSHARVDGIMHHMATRRPVPGDVGTVTLKSGIMYGARVLRRENEDALAVRFTDGPQINAEVVIPDHRFKKASKSTDVRV